MKEILQQNKISTEDAANIFHFVTMQKEIYEQMLYSGPLQNDVPELTREEFEQYPMVLSLSGLFFESDIFIPMNSICSIYRRQRTMQKNTKIIA